MRINLNLKISAYSLCLLMVAGALNGQNTQNAQNPQRQRQRSEQPPQTLVQNPNANLYGAHDPVMIKQDSVYYPAPIW
jgi:hypothetical protein